MQELIILRNPTTVWYEIGRCPEIISVNRKYDQLHGSFWHIAVEIVFVEQIERGIVWLCCNPREIHLHSMPDFSTGPG